MTDPRSLRRRGAAALAALALAAVAAPAPAQALELGELMGLLAQRPRGEARFTEERVVQGLDQPLIASGTLSFTAPDRFERRTLKPRPETLSVDGNTLTLTRSGRSRTMTLDAAPEAAAIVEAVRGTLTGNGAALQRLYRPTVRGSAAQWSLSLMPLDAALIAQVRAVQIDGQQDQVRRVEVMLADGDRSTMRIEPLDVEPAPPAAPAR